MQHLNFLQILHHCMLGRRRVIILMAKIELQQRLKSVIVTAAFVFCWALFESYMGDAERLLPNTQIIEKESKEGFSAKLLHFFWQSGKSSYEHVWPVSNKFLHCALCIVFVFLLKYSYFFFFIG